MKKAALVLLVLLATTATAHAQLKAGIKGGGNLSSLRFSEHDQFKPAQRIGYYGGLHASVKLLGNLYLQPELLYSVKEFKIKNQFDPLDHMEYITLPVLLKYEFYERVAIMGGAEFGALAKGTRTSFNQPEVNAKEFYTNADVGFVAGVSVNLTDWLGLEARYNSGFVPLQEFIYTDNESLTLKKIKDGYNRNFQLGVYFTILD